MKTIIDKIKHQLFLSVHGEAWHGSSLHEILAPIDDENIAVKMLPGFSHNIAEITFHIIAWTEEVTARLKGKQPSLPERGDWKTVITITGGEWNDFKKELISANEKLLDVLNTITDLKLNDKVGNTKGAPLGTGSSYEEMLYGLLQHNAYHGGQIALIHKAIQNGKSHL